jgi:hypothetical protein
VIYRCLSIPQVERYQSMAELLEDLEDDRAARGRSRWPLVLLLAALAAVLFALYV